MLLAMPEPSSATTAVSDPPVPENGKGPASDCEGLRGPGIHAKLPNYGKAYLNLLVGEFKSLRDICENKDAKELAQELVDRAEKGDTMTWGDAYMLDTFIAQMLPDEYLHQRAWCLEVKYKDAVGNADAYNEFMKSESAHLLPESNDHLRARVHNMIRELYRLYTVISCRGDMREALSKSALKTLAIVFVAMAAALGIADYFLGSPHYLEVWCMVFAAGATGGLLSLQRRLQSLPSYGESLSDLVELSGRMTVRFTPIIGGVFAIVLFLIFASGLASGTLFPILPNTAKVSDFKAFIEHLQPENTVEWGKLLVWSFAAGFAERLVPDTLDRLIARSEQSKNKVK
jgi:hypothetical protein